MSSDTILRDEDGNTWSFDNLSTCHYLEGHAPGAEAAAGFLFEKATRIFLAGDTKKAEVLRDAAEEIMKDFVPKLKQKAKDHAEVYPELLKKGKR